MFFFRLSLKLTGNLGLYNIYKTSGDKDKDKFDRKKLLYNTCDKDKARVAVDGIGNTDSNEKETD